MQTDNVLTWFAFKRWLLFETSSSLKLFFRIAGLILFILGLICLVFMIKTKQQLFSYTFMKQCRTKSNNNICMESITIKQDMNPPIKFLYYLQNIYINHRKYLNSLSRDQLKGVTIDINKAQKQCYPIVTNADMNATKSWAGQPLDPQAIANPCGLMAALHFTDKFQLLDSTGKQIPINQKGVSLGINKNKIFKRAVNSEKTQWLDPQNQHFINWMQSQSLMTKKKLWGKIETKLSAGNYTLKVQNNFGIGKLRLSKGIELTESSPFGGKVYFIPLTLILLGIIAWIFTFYLGYKFDSHEQILKNYRQ